MCRKEREKEKKEKKGRIPIIAKMSVRMRKYFTRPDGNHDVNIYIISNIYIDA